MGLVHHFSQENPKDTHSPQPKRYACIILKLTLAPLSPVSPFSPLSPMFPYFHSRRYKRILASMACINGRNSACLKVSLSLQVFHLDQHYLSTLAHPKSQVINNNILLLSEMQSVSANSLSTTGLDCHVNNTTAKLCERLSKLALV